MPSRMDWADVCSSQGAERSVSGRIMTVCTGAIIGISGSGGNGLVCLESYELSPLTRRCPRLKLSITMLNVCRDSRVIRLGIVVYMYGLVD